MKKKKFYGLRDKSTGGIAAARNTGPYKESEIPDGFEQIESDFLSAGGTFNDSSFKPPVPVEHIDPVEVVDFKNIDVESIDALNVVNALKKTIKYLQKNLTKG